MKKILIATSGYYYNDWKGIFYPEDLPAKEYLSYYSGIFPFTELNFSYYRQPEKKQMEHFLDATEDTFLFTVKAHRSLTHDRPENWRDEAIQFLRGIGPLKETERLGSVLLQFPYSFKYTKENRIYLAELCSTLSRDGDSLPLSLEFRNTEWNNERVFGELSRREAVWINSDNPELPGLPVRELKQSTRTAYLRFHGRNRENWWKGNNISRYDYNYSEKELEEAAEAILKLAKQVKRVFIAFNNHHKGQAVNNALKLTALLEGC